MEATRLAATGDAASPRLRRIKERLLATKPTVCLERARFYTEAYRRFEAKPLIIRRALALRETLEQGTIFIDEGELIVGNQGSRLKAAPIFPEYAVAFLLEELDSFERRPGDAFFLSPEDKREIRELCSWWVGKTVHEKGLELMSDDLRLMYDSGLIRAEANLTCGDGHIAVDFPRLLADGLGGYRKRVREAAEKLDRTDWADLRKGSFYQSVEIALQAVGTFIRRFAALAREMAAAEGEAHRRAELSLIAQNCLRIAQDPPESFHQALQLVYFIQLVLQIESNGHSVSLGRLDQYLLPFYRADLRRGVLSQAQAEELLGCLWLKLLGINKIRPWSHTRYTAGSPLYQNVTIGGSTPEGADAVNELSYAVLRSVGSLRLPQPNLSVRYHRGVSDEFMRECLRVIEKGFGMPAFMNDEIIVPALRRLGVQAQDAQDYSAIGCVEVAVPGRWGYRCTGMSFLNLMRVLLAALNDGLDRRSGRTFCPGTGRFEDMGSFDEVMKAWKRQIEFFARATVAIDTAADTALEENVPDVLCSALVQECIERGKTIKEGGAKYDFISGLQVGMANLANSLSAIKTLVFDQKKISPAELMAALDADYEGPAGERLRQLIVQRAPKYGNDDDSVDLLLREAYAMFLDEISRHHNTRYGRGPIGGTYYGGTSSVAANVPSGAAVGATPDGRKAGRPLAEGSSPSSGTDRLGPTAVLKSVSKLPAERIVGGVLLNQKLSPTAIRDENDRLKLIRMLRAFFDELKGWHVQYNIVSRETLLAAQADPESHRDLVVRVAGYSAFFTILAPETQDDIIARTEHTLAG